MNKHHWQAHGYPGAAILEGLTYITAVATYRCHHCGEEVTIPDCGKNTCLVLLSLGCTNEFPPKEKWQCPIKEKAPFEEKRDYPKRRKKK